MTPPLGYGVDVSHFQSTAAIPRADFCIVRASYGALLRDDRAVAHVARARLLGMKVGLYFFWRSIHSTQAQLDLFRQVADDIGYHEGDIVPAIDIEADTFPTMRPACPEWSGPAEEITNRLVEIYGNALVYCTHREWGMMGSPEWMLHRPLWVAHYIDGAPATPGNMPATIHQHRVGPFLMNGPGGTFHGAEQIDQNRLLQPLPLIGSVIDDAERARIAGLVAASVAQSAMDAEPFPLPPDAAA